MTASNDHHASRAVFGYLVPWALFGLLVSGISKDGYAPFWEQPADALVITGLFTGIGMGFLVAGMVIRSVFRRNYLPAHFGRGLCCGCLTIVCGLLCLLIESGGFVLIAAMCIAVIVFPFWNGKESPPESH